MQIKGMENTHARTFAIKIFPSGHVIGAGERIDANDARIRRNARRKRLEHNKRSWEALFVVDVKPRTMRLIVFWRWDTQKTAFRGWSNTAASPMIESNKPVNVPQRQ